jgi:hypothetical protein
MKGDDILARFSGVLPEWRKKSLALGVQLMPDLLVTRRTFSLYPLTIYNSYCR